MQENQSEQSLGDGIHLFDTKSLVVTCLLLINLACLCACTELNQKEQQVQKYLDHIDQLKSQVNQHLNFKGSDDKPKLTSIKDLDLENLRLPSTRFRRFTLAESPQLNFRQFMSISDCSLSRHIAFRNSPLGRMMLPAQELAYNHRFLKAAKQCEGHLEPKLDDQLKKVIKFKESQWADLHWNAIWGGTPLAKFFSLAWPRGDQIKSLDAQDEAQLAWLAELNPSYKGDLSNELEQKLAQLPNYVGGQVLLNAYYAWFFLKASHPKLVQVDKLSALMTKSDSATCKIFEQSMQVFAEAQFGMSKAYQQLEALQASFAGLIKLQKQSRYPSPILTDFIERWLSTDHPQSTKLEFKTMIKAQVQLWLKIKKSLKCL